jgi:hypothetical protein
LNIEADLEHQAASNVLDVLRKTYPGGELKIEKLIPSVTNYVFDLKINQRSFIAKHNFLGWSKTHLLKECHQRQSSQWVISRQRDYIQTRTTLQREAEAIRFLDDYFPQLVAGLIVYTSGVLVLHKQAGAQTLQAILADEAVNLNRLYEQVHQAMQTVHALSKKPEEVEFVEKAFPLAEIETDIIRKFSTKFLSVNSGVYIQSLGKDWDTDQAEYIVETYHLLCEIIAPRIDQSELAERTCVIYGDLKPENILLQPSGQPCLIDPELHMARPSFDIARLIGRSLLAVLHPLMSKTRKREIANALLIFADLAGQANPTVTDPAKLEREVVLICAMDLLNILSTYLNLNPAQLGNYPENVRSNYQNSREILSRIKMFFNLKTGDQQLTSIDELVAIFL